MVAHIFRFGRKQYQKGAIYYSIGRKEIKKHQHICPELQHMNGVHLVISLQGDVITMFKNKDFKHIRHC